MGRHYEIVKFQAAEGEEAEYYFFRETVIKTFFNDKGLPISNGLAWIVNIETGESLTVPHEYLILVTANNNLSEEFKEVITKIKNNKK